jgi:penicillin-binding protein 1A
MNGMVPEQIIDDAPFAIGDWTPSNYLHEAIGSIFLKDAFAESVNSVTIFLVKKYGLSRLINLARQFGVSGHMENDMSISLGSACITLLQLAQTILIVMNDGYQVAPYGILEIKDAEGKVIWAKDFSLPEKIKDNEHAFWHMKETMLHTIQSPRGTGRMAKVPGVKRAGKTGTSGNGKCPNDLWFACFEEEMLCCTWFGKDDGSMMQKGAGQKNPAVLAVKEFMSKADGKAISKSVKKIIADSPKSSSMETLLDLPEVFQDPFSI